MKPGKLDWNFVTKLSKHARCLISGNQEQSLNDTAKERVIWKQLQLYKYIFWNGTKILYLCTLATNYNGINWRSWFHWYNRQQNDEKEKNFNGTCMQTKRLLTFHRSAECADLKHIYFILISLEI